MIERPDASEAQPQGLCLDKGYDYPEVHELAAELGFRPHIRARGEEAKLIERKPGFRARSPSPIGTPTDSALGPHVAGAARLNGDCGPVED